MKIIVTGGNGQIGSHVIELLIKENVDQIINIDNFITGKKYHLLDHEKLTKINGSIDDSILINKTFEKFKPNIIIHTAASYNEPENWVRDVKTNGIGIQYSLLLIPSSNIFKASSYSKNPSISTELTSFL